MRAVKTLPALAFFLLAPIVANAQTTWYVDGVRGSDSNAGTSPQTAYQTLGMALSVARASDTVAVAPAVYSPSRGESLPLHVGAGVALLGADPRACILDAEAATTGYSGDMLVLHTATRLAGFTLRNGPHSSANWYAAAIRIADGSGLLDGVLVERCIVDTAARGMRIGDAGNAVQNLTVRSNFFIRNSADAIGLHSGGTSPSLGNAIYNNTVIGDPARVTVTRSTLVLGGAAVADIYNNNFYGFDFCGIEVSAGCAISTWNNNYYLHTGAYGGTYCVDPSATFSSSRDSSSDPSFVDPATDPHLKTYSPCIDAGATLTSLTDIDGNGLQGTAPDQGCDETMQAHLAADLYLWPVHIGGENATLTSLGQGPNGVLILAATALSPAGPLNLGAMGTLHIDPLQMFPFATGTLNRSSLFTIRLPLPANPWLLGTPIYMQGLHYTAGLQQMGLTDLEVIKLGR